MSQLDARTAQVTRWCMTLNNNNPSYKYKEHFSKVEFKVNRAIWGREVAPQTGTPHLQGYFEFYRTVRLGHLRKLAALVFWEPARGSSLVNYTYCSKGDDFECLGDFSCEAMGQSRSENARKRPASVNLILRGLLHEEYSTQIKVTKEYSDRHVYYDKATSILKDLQMQHKYFSEWQDKMLFKWQYQLLENLLEQSDRKIIWVVDSDGNTGKTFLCRYMNAMYKFAYLDGVISTRDIGTLLNPSIKGVVLDVNRSAYNNFDYSVIESLKNGVVVSGKYRGLAKQFDNLKVAVFSNSFPNFAMLSRDRWDVIVLGEGEFSDLDKSPIVSPKSRFPFLSPLPLPELSDSFDLRSFLEARLPDDSRAKTPAVQVSEDQNFLEGSQVPGPSTVLIECSLNINSQSQDHVNFTRGLQMNVVSEGTATLCNLHRGRKFNKGCPCVTKAGQTDRQVIISPRSAATSEQTSSSSSSGEENSSQVAAPQVATPLVATPQVAAPQVAAPQVATPQVATPQVATPQVATPQVATPQVATPQVATPQVATPQVAAPQVAAPQVAAPQAAAPQAIASLSEPTSDQESSSAGISCGQPLPSSSESEIKKLRKRRCSLSSSGSKKTRIAPSPNNSSDEISDDFAVLPSSISKRRINTPK